MAAHPGSTAANSEPARAQRADARRNVETILIAARDCLAEDPDATLAQIAQTAGVGRITLYGHFRTRAELLDAVLDHIAHDAALALDAVDTTGDPVAALSRLAAASWRIVHQYTGVMRAAQRELGSESIRATHDLHLRQLQELIEAGRASGQLRTDLPADWLLSVCYAIMHAAAESVATGRLSAREAEHVITRTITSALTSPGTAGTPDQPGHRPSKPPRAPRTS